MLLAPAVVAVAVGLGYALGGRLGNLTRAGFRLWPLIVVGYVLQEVPVPGGVGAGRAVGFGLLGLSFACILTFVVANLGRPGLWLLGLGFALNGLVIAVNAGMPVSVHALHRANPGGDLAGAVAYLGEHGGVKHHVAGPGDTLMPLADVIGIPPPVMAVFSVGDFLWLAGLGWALVAGMRWRPSSRGEQGRGPVSSGALEG